MQRKLTLATLALALMAAPVTFAHTDGGGPGTPDFTCQRDPAEWQVHDYAGANGRTVTSVADYNLEECGTTYGLFIAGNPECREIEDRLGQGPGSPLWELFCNTDRPADYDGDLEHAVGGAVLASVDGDGETYGALVCLGTEGHHLPGASIYADDEVFADVVLRIGADASIPGTVPPGEPDCGDGANRPCGDPATWTGDATVDGLINEALNGACNPDDHQVVCLNGCAPPFGPGIDGTYTVWVGPSLNGNHGNPTGASHGHIYTDGPCPSTCEPISPPQCSDDVDNDGDESIDWDGPGRPDPGCLGPNDNDESNDPLPCGDGRDNDRDGGVDAQDRECYKDNSCKVEDYDPTRPENNNSAGHC